MKYEIRYKPSYSMLVVDLEAGEKITAESGSMTYMDPNIDVHTRKREKSLLGSLGLKILGRQSFWVNDYTASLFGFERFGRSSVCLSTCRRYRQIRG